MIKEDPQADSEDEDDEGRTILESDDEDDRSQDEE